MRQVIGELEKQLQQMHNDYQSSFENTQQLVQQIISFKVKVLCNPTRRIVNPLQGKRSIPQTQVLNKPNPL